MFQRAKQFFLYINYKITEDDIKFINKYLNDDQILLFSKLKEHEQKHSINVAKKLEACCEEKNLQHKEDLVLAALLHDIGKIEYQLNLIDKSALVILDKVSNGKMRKYSYIKKVDIFYNHAEKGYDILKKMGENSRILYLVKNHHNNEVNEDIELNMLKKYDDEN